MFWNRKQNGNTDNTDGGIKTDLLCPADSADIRRKNGNTDNADWAEEN